MIHDELRWVVIRDSDRKGQRAVKSDWKMTVNSTMGLLK